MIDEFSWREPTKEMPCKIIAMDVSQQVFIPVGILVVTTETGKIIAYDAKNYCFRGLEDFLKGKDMGNGIKELPRRIEYWMPMPELKEQK